MHLTSRTYLCVLPTIACHVQPFIVITVLFCTPMPVKRCTLRSRSQWQNVCKEINMLLSPTQIRQSFQFGSAVKFRHLSNELDPPQKINVCHF